MAVVVRDLGPADHESAAELFTTAFPDRAGEPPSWAAEDPSRRALRWTAGDAAGGQVVGYAAVWRVRRDKFRMDLVVRADTRRRGVGSRLLARLADRARGTGAATLQARAPAEDGEARSFLDRRGFAKTMTMYRLALDVAGANLAPFVGVEERLAAAGVRITTLAEELAADPACWEKLRDLYNAVREGWPDPDPGPEDPLTGEQFRRLWAAFPTPPDEVFLARRGDDYVGFTGGVGTGVRPANRNRGIATALKVRAIARVRDCGEPAVTTASGSPAMLRVNEKLGFRRVAAEVRWVKRLR